jgi:hypothetical protein
VTLLEKPYTTLPDYADVAYVDGKLSVAQYCLKAARTQKQKDEWHETIDILLGQRLALASLEEV